MASGPEHYDSSPPESFGEEVLSELTWEVLEDRWQDVNVLPGAPGSPRFWANLG